LLGIQVEKYSDSVLYGVYLIADPMKKPGDIILPLDPAAKLPSAVTNYGYNYSLESYITDPVGEIDPHTLRLKYLQGTWIKKSEQIHHCSVDKQLSYFNLFIQCVTDFNYKHQRYPTLNEYVIWMYDRESQRETPRNTLCQESLLFANKTVNMYEQVGVFLHQSKNTSTDAISVDEFIRITNKSRDKKVREQIES
jgi:hypothetical protein